MKLLLKLLVPALVIGGISLMFGYLLGLASAPVGTLHMPPETVSVGSISKLGVLHNSTHIIESKAVWDDVTCSATAIGPHALLTASHCEVPSERVKIDDSRVGYVVARIRDGNDHSIWLLRGTSFDAVASFSTLTELQQGDAVFAWGSPAGTPDLFRRGYFMGWGKKEKWVDDKERAGMLFDLNGGPGDSGSALFDPSGRIVAVTNSKWTPWNGDAGYMGAFPLEFTPQEIARAQEF